MDPRPFRFARHFARTLTIATLATLAAGGCGPAAEETELRRSSIVNGEIHTGHPAVGALIQEGGGLCTATLVGAKTVLTAGHCVTPGNAHFFVVGSVRYDAVGVARHPQYSAEPVDNDVALVRLHRAPLGVDPAPITVQAPRVDEVVTLVGFGAVSTSGGGSGLKRLAMNKIDRLTPNRLVLRGAGGGAGNLCFGDSGGPTFATINGEEVQVGVHSTISGNCGYEGHDMRVDFYREWIKKTAGGDVIEGGFPDTAPPQLALLAPTSADELYPQLAVEVEVTDDRRVALVELKLDDEVVATSDEAPAAADDRFLFELRADPGPHRLEVIAHDGVGKTASAAIEVEVLSEKPFGDPCAAAEQCVSGLCGMAADGAEEICTIKCHPAGTPCPGAAECRAAAEGGAYVCVPDEGGCNVSAGGGPPAGAVALLALAILAAAARRRRARPR